jgi:uncharacterized protein YegJ (DUF2314 family)
MARSKSQVFMFDNSDPEMRAAYARARDTFRLFWREVARDRRRIIPALNLAAVKAPFSDPKKRGAKGDPEVEHMWLSDVDYDGETVSGELVNAPNKLKTIKQGDTLSVPVGGLSDWMYVLNDIVFGGFSVNLLRARMSAKERKNHDAAWGLNFGDPTAVRTSTEQERHEIDVATIPTLREHLAQHPAAVSATGHFGWTLLHHKASIGSAEAVAVLLRAGADPHVMADDGVTPLQLARALGWEAVAELLAGK